MAKNKIFADEPTGPKTTKTGTHFCSPKNNNPKTFALPFPNQQNQAHCCLPCPSGLGLLFGLVLGFALWLLGLGLVGFGVWSLGLRFGPWGLAIPSPLFWGFALPHNKFGLNSDWSKISGLAR